MNRGLLKTIFAILYGAGEITYIIVFTLNQLILPGLYVILFFINILLQERQMVAFLVVAVLHVYINLMQIRMVRQYFK